MSRSCAIDGRATFTIVLSSMIMNRPNETATSVHHFLFSGAKILALIRSFPGRKLVGANLAATSLPTGRALVTLPAVADVIWRPSAEQREATNAMRLVRRLGCEDYAALVRLSQDDPDVFWPAVIEDLGLEFFEPWHTVCDLSRGPEWATWFRGGTLNLAWNCVHRWARGERADADAAVWQSEDGGRRALTYRE